MLGPSGSQVVGPLQSTATYSLTCHGEGGSASASRTVTVVPEPTISLSASEAIVPVGEAITLSWTANHAHSCQADGGWTGSRGLEGAEVVSGLTGQTTFTLTCQGTGGSAVVMTSVSTLGEVSISWVAPSENVDGTPLVDLQSYRIYVGEESRNYGQVIDVTNANSTSHAFTVPSGEYYVTMTALDTGGNESAFANEILKIIP